MPTQAALSASLEDYLEAIYFIVRKKQAARAKDIADRLNVHRSSVTNALRALREHALVNYAPYDVVTLTPKGKEMGADIARRHEVLSDFFVKVLSVDEELADQTACKMEHSVPRQVLERFIDFVNYLESCPRGGAKWVDGMGYFCSEGCTLDDCERCIEQCLADVRKRKRGAGTASSAQPTALDALAPGAKARIVGVRAQGPRAVRMEGMGIAPGAVVQIERPNPGDGTVNVKVRGYHLSLQGEDLADIDVEPVVGLSEDGDHA